MEQTLEEKANDWLIEIVCDYNITIKRKELEKIAKALATFIQSEIEQAKEIGFVAARERHTVYDNGDFTMPCSREKYATLESYKASMDSKTESK